MVASASPTEAATTRTDNMRKAKVLIFISCSTASVAPSHYIYGAGSMNANITAAGEDSEHLPPTPEGTKVRRCRSRAVTMEEGHGG